MRTPGAPVHVQQTGDDVEATVHIAAVAVMDAQGRQAGDAVRRDYNVPATEARRFCYNASVRGEWSRGRIDGASNTILR